jgi:hypothetical protein
MLDGVVAVGSRSSPALPARERPAFEVVGLTARADFIIFGLSESHPCFRSMHCPGLR